MDSLPSHSAYFIKKPAWPDKIKTVSVEKQH